jgi:regulator of cell morphogenesis and NO signaling
MITLDEGKTVGDLVAELPSRSRIFEQLGIDYCCGGKQSLAAACQQKNLDPAAVLELLDNQAVSPEDQDEISPARMAMTELADHIEKKHHAWLRQELPRIAKLMQKVVSVHGGDHGWLRDLERVYEGLDSELTSHMMKEEQILFPLIRQLEAGVPLPAMLLVGLHAPINCMENEHESAGRALQSLRQLSNNYTPPTGACNTFCVLLAALAELEADLHLHIHKENNILFPAAMEMCNRRAAQQGACA